MLYADSAGRIYDHPYYRMVGFCGSTPAALQSEELIPLPSLSKLFYLPDCPPVGRDPTTGQCRVVREVEINGDTEPCFAVAAFPEPGIVRSLLPAADYGNKRYTLPMWAYTAVGFKEERYWAAGFRIEYNPKWDPQNYDDRELLPAIEAFQQPNHSGALAEHLVECAVGNHCFAAKNLFLGRWEAPLPVSRACNAACLGCLSFQTDDLCAESHQRLTFRPAKEEIVSLAVRHLTHATEAIVSFGQGCEGEPLTEYQLIADSIREIRNRTRRGTINLNTNGSWPERIRALIASGLDSIRISLNSARPELYRAYYRPQNYDYYDVVDSLTLCRRKGLYTMINYLVFPGITDQEAEIGAFVELVRKTGVNFVHLKNLCIDPRLYLKAMPELVDSAPIGMRRMVGKLKAACPALEIGYFNQPVRNHT
jgi:pyruvate-formate lyase-activating enzyme